MNPGDPILSAWLDRQLPPAEVAVFEARLSAEPDLARQAEAFGTLDALLSDWHASLPAAPPARKPRRRLGYAAAAALLLAALLTPLLDLRDSESFAEEALDRTAAAIDAAEGLLAEFRLSLTSGPERAATGTVRFSRLSSPGLFFTCEERWPASQEGAQRIRVRGQNLESAWMIERKGGQVSTQSMDWRIDDVPPGEMEARYGTLKEGSPVDIRTRQGIEGLAMLVRHFRREEFRRWMGCAWGFGGGAGTPADPWIYTAEPLPRILWRIRLSTGENGVVNALGVEEEILDTDDAVRSRLRVDYDLTLCRDPWPSETFDMKEAP